MNSLLHTLARWFSRKTVPPALTGGQWTGTSYIDAYKRNRNPTPNELMAELKGAAWTCASINASVCASFAPKLYVKLPAGKAKSCRWPTQPVPPWRKKALETQSGGANIEEVLDHPLLTMLRFPNANLSAFDVWELTQLYLEVHGRAFWYLERDHLETPCQIWVLPSQNVTPKRAPDSTRIIDYFGYRTGHDEQRFDPQDVVFFRYPDPRDPYLGGLAPLRACYEQVALASEYAATKWAIYQNNAIPSALISPEEVIGEEERDRLETQWNAKFRRGGAGRVVVGESNLKVQLLQHSLGDLAALAEMKVTKEDIANSFHVPLSYLTSETNLANLQAADHQHMSKAILPRLMRRDECLNRHLVSQFDPDGHLFLASQNPVPDQQDYILRVQDSDLKFGVRTINEVRSPAWFGPRTLG